MDRYFVAVATSDGVHVDTPFGETMNFDIYEITKDSFQKIGKRIVEETTSVPKNGQGQCDEQHREQNRDALACGCGGSEAQDHHCGVADSRVGLLSDCQFVVCSKIGFPMQKQLAKRAISAFDVECTVDEALDKIRCYLTRQGKVR